MFDVPLEIVWIVPNNLIAKVFGPEHGIQEEPEIMAGVVVTVEIDATRLLEDPACISRSLRPM